MFRDRIPSQAARFKDAAVEAPALPAPTYAGAARLARRRAGDPARLSAPLRGARAPGGVPQRLEAGLAEHPEWTPVCTLPRHRPSRREPPQEYPMKLLVKFNLMFLLVMALGLAVSGWISRSLLQAQRPGGGAQPGAAADGEGDRRARLHLGQIAQLLETQMKYAFLPQSVPSYSAVEVLATLQKKHPDFAYKEATLNPTNPRDRAVDWEVDIVNQFRSNADDDRESSASATRPTGPSLYIARPLRITNPACLQCHSSVDAAPQDDDRPLRPGQRLRLAAERGHRRADHLGADGAAAAACRASRSRSSWPRRSAVFVVIGVVLNLMIWLLIVRPVTRLSRAGRPRQPGRPGGAGVRRRQQATRSACWPPRSPACARASCRR